MQSEVAMEALVKRINRKLTEIPTRRNHHER
jgi:hypothetical protein